MLKWTIRVLLAIVVVVVAAVLAVVILVNPNDYKGHIEQAAAGQGLSLKISGDIGWQFFPQLGFTIGATQLSPASAPEQTFAQIENFTIALAVAPLLQKQILIKQLNLDGLAVNLEVDQAGRGNWEQLQGEAPTAPPPAEDSPAAEATVPPVELSIPLVAITNARLHYRSAADQQDIRIEPIDLHLQGFNLKEQQLGLQQLNFAIPHLQVSGKATLSLGEEMSYTGQFQLQSESLRSLLQSLNQSVPATADPAVLGPLNLQGQVQGSSTAIELPQLKLQLDDTHLSGTAHIRDLASQDVVAQLQGDRFDLDRYTPPPSEEPAAADGAKVQGAKNPGGSPANVQGAKAQGGEPQAELIPTALLKALNAHLQLSFDELKASELIFRHTILDVEIREGLMELKKLNADFYEGKIKLQARVDARQGLPPVSLQATVSKVKLHPVLKILADLDIISGTTDVDIKLNTRGLTQSQLTRALNGNLVITGNQVAVEGLNVEEQYCAAQALIKPENRVTRSWAQHTEFRTLRVPIAISQGVMDLAGTRAQVANIQVNGSGSVNLPSEVFDLHIGATSTAAESSDGGCVVTSGWRDREIPIQCKGSFSGEPSCGLDSAQVREMIKDKAKRTVEKKAKEKIEEKLLEKIDKDKVPGLRDLFKKF